MLVRGRNIDAHGVEMHASAPRLMSTSAATRKQRHLAAIDPMFVHPNVRQHLSGKEVRSSWNHGACSPR